MYCSGGQCACLSTFILREGYCYERGSSDLYFICPLPEGAGFKISLNDPDPQFGSFPVGCTVGSSVQVEPVAGLHGGAACLWPSTGEFVGDIYDCIQTSPQSQHAAAANVLQKRVALHSYSSRLSPIYPTLCKMCETFCTLIAT
uniref:CUB domain-containing protein n=1 Tax=Steinernema glaseri TaxID=37863 RepID=A0A1I7YLF0_9BILA